MDERLQEDLVALVKDELPAERKAELEALAERDAAVREELEQIRAALRAVHRIGMVEPSAAFRKKLEQRIRDSVVHKERSGRLKRPGSTALRLTSVESPSASALRAAEAARSSRKTSASIRLAERRDRPAGLGWLRYAALAAAMVLLTLTLAHFFYMPSGRPADEAPLTAMMQRWNERREAPRWEDVLKGDAVAAAKIPDGTELVLLGNYKEGGQENCVVAYTESQLEALRAHAGVDPKDLEARLALSFKATVENGAVVVPPQLRARFFKDASARVVILACPDRFELWSEPDFQRYLDAEPKLEAVPPKTGS
ncbi:MAG: hypothetical protein M5U26_30240 [Planctomycetota bacterium]|nr:hypothetical protein [Planctomycetota bacterium]